MTFNYAISNVRTSYIPNSDSAIRAQTSAPPYPLGSPRRSIGLDRVGWVCRRNPRLQDFLPLRSAKGSVDFCGDGINEDGMRRKTKEYRLILSNSHLVYNTSLRIRERMELMEGTSGVRKKQETICHICATIQSLF